MIHAWESDKKRHSTCEESIKFADYGLPSLKLEVNCRHKKLNTCEGVSPTN